jgi:ABC-type histidine transport system ATPase subunit
MYVQSEAGKNTSPNLMLDIINVKKAFGDLEVLKGIDLQVTRGQIVSIIALCYARLIT